MNTGDIVGVLLDMDEGTISFFKDGEDFNLSRVVVVNMGVAYHNLRRNNRSPSSVLYPCFGIKTSGDQLSLRSSKWVSVKGLGSAALLNLGKSVGTHGSQWNRPKRVRNAEARGSNPRCSTNNTQSSHHLQSRVFRT